MMDSWWKQHASCSWPMERKIKGTKNVDILEMNLGQRTTAFRKNFSTSQMSTSQKEKSSSHTNLLSKPFVQLLAAVEHKTFSLWSFLALSHQSGVLISLKQSWNLTTTKHALNFCCCWRQSHIQCMLNSGRERLPNQLKLWTTNSETEKRKIKLE